MKWSQLISNKRLGQEELHLERKDDRTEFKRDYDRLIFSAAFRRLQNKTQVFPLPGSIFVHNRLTHSLEVASVGRSLGDDVARKLLELHPELRETHVNEIGDVVCAACLAHDLGNPPFGHSGERAIATFFSEGPGLQYREMMSPDQWADFIRFDGNANAFRLLAHTFKGRRKGGFVMTYPTLASIVKYPFPASEATRQKFGYFRDDESLYLRIARELGIQRAEHVGTESWGGCRYPLAYLVEAADDICYEIMDIEDAHKLKILSTEETQQLLLGFYDEERQEKMRKVMKMLDDENEQIVYLRSCAIGALEHECVRVFVENEEAILDGSFKGSLLKHCDERIRTAYARCAQVAEDKIYTSRDVVNVELAGYKIISTLMELFATAAMTPEKAYSELLLKRVSSQYEIEREDTYGRLLAVLDFISGMTDVFALDLYRKIRGESLPSI